MLCQEHNTALSPLDARIARVFRHLASTDKVLTASDPTAHAVHCVNGHDFERWLLKAFLGAMKAGAWKQAEGGPLWAPPSELLGVLFDGRSLPAGYGLTISLPKAGETTKTSRSLYFSPAQGSAPLRGTMTFGCTLWMQGVNFNALLPTQPGERLALTSDDDTTVVYRPGEVRWFCGRRYVSLVFSWDKTSGSRGTIVPIEWKPRPTDPEAGASDGQG